MIDKFKILGVGIILFYDVFFIMIMAYYYLLFIKSIYKVISNSY